MIFWLKKIQNKWGLILKSNFLFDKTIFFKVLNNSDFFIKQLIFVFWKNLKQTHPMMDHDPLYFSKEMKNFIYENDRENKW